MTLRSIHTFTGSLLALAGAAAMSASARGNINLELRPVGQTALVGSTISLGLYAVSDSAANQGISAADVILGWDTTHLSLLGVNNTSPPTPMSFSGFPNDPYGINDTWSDGDAIWTGFAPFLMPVMATPASSGGGGTLLTTFQFQALAATVLVTHVDMLISAGNPLGETRVLGSDAPNQNVTGTLSGATITIIVPAPGAGAAMLLALFTGACGRRRRRAATQSEA